MIEGKVVTESGPHGETHSGHVTVTNESIGPLDVLPAQLPELKKGHRRLPAAFRLSDDGGTVTFRIEDRKH